MADISGREKGNSGRKESYQNEIKNAVEAVPINNGGTIRRILLAAAILKSTLQNSKKRRTITRHSSSTKHSLTDNYEMERIKLAYLFIHSITTGGNTYSSNKTKKVFDSMNNFICIDEKWFRPTFEKSNVCFFSKKITPTVQLRAKTSFQRLCFNCSRTT